jgi:hypothetical protein
MEESMLRVLSRFRIVVIALCILLAVTGAKAQNAGTIHGVVKDPSGGVIPGAMIQINDPVSTFQRQTAAGADGSFSFTNVPFNTYHMVVSAPGFASNVQDVDVRSAVPVSLEIVLKVGAATQTVTVEANTLVENTSTFHTDVDQGIIDKLPLESPSSSVSSLVTLVTPGIAADSNGLFHGMGDHAENSFSVDGQPITDQQSKVFSNQIPEDSIQSLEVISGAPPAEYGDKTSVVIKVTTKSGLGVTTPTGSVYSSYGSFGTANAGFDFEYGGRKWGNFIAANGLRTSRFLDPPELTPMHDKGNEENLFDRVDYQISHADTVHLNGEYTRSWFQNPNTYDQQLHTCSAGFTCNASGVAVNPLNGAPLGPTDQRSQIKTYNLAPEWTRLISTKALFTFGAYVRKDHYNFYPSADPFADFSPDLESQTIAQDRTLTNAGLHSSISYVSGIHNLKAGVQYDQTFLTENDALGTVDPGFLALFNLLDPNGNPIPGTSCLDASGNPIAPPCTNLAPSDLTRGGTPFLFHGHTDVKELALYVEDTIKTGNWSFDLGVRGDKYNGLSTASQAEPRLGISYNIKPSSTVLRLSYARTMETPFNENLVISDTGCSNQVIKYLLPPPNVVCNLGSIVPGERNEFHAGLEQAFGQHLVIDGEYIWKYTHGAYDFGVVASTPIAFPIEWHNSKIPGYAVRVNVPDVHGFTGLVVMSGVAARFFNPQVGGTPFLPATNVFRIDHDEHFNQTSHLQYQPWKGGPWLGFNWRYDSGLVAGAIPCFAPTPTCGFSTGPNNTVLLINNVTGLPLTADQEFQSGLTCNGVPAAPSPIGTALASCPAGELGSKFINIPAPGTENDDHNPQRIAPRSLFDLAVGDDNLFHGDRYKWSLQFTLVNLTNKAALYNFFSTFSGTHYVTPRTETVQLGFHF